MGERVVGSTRHNSFDALRLVGAMAVLVSHSFAVTGWKEPHIGPRSLGGLGVILFFGISGFLITQSWVTDPSPWHFAAKRALRILPALAAMLVVVALGIGPLVTTSTTGAYLSAGETWRYVYDNILMIPQFSLPGVFKANRFYAGTVNVSIWTLTHEVHAYLAVAVLGLAGALRRRWLALGGFALLAVLAHVFPDGVHGVGDPGLLAAFATGGILYVWREAVPWSLPFATAVGSLALLAAYATPFGVKALTFAVPYLAIWAAYRFPDLGTAVTRHGDLSYGIYLWAWPAQMLVASAWPSVGPWALIALVTPLASGAAFVSWHAVERPALRAKRLLQRGANAPPTVSPATAVAR